MRWHHPALVLLALALVVRSSGCLLLMGGAQRGLAGWLGAPVFVAWLWPIIMADDYRTITYACAPYVFVFVFVFVVCKMDF